MASDETPTTYLKDYEAYPYLVPRVRARPRPRTPPRSERRAPSRLAIASFQIHVSRPADPSARAFAIRRDAAIPRLHAAPSPRRAPLDPPIPPKPSNDTLLPPPPEPLLSSSQTDLAFDLEEAHATVTAILRLEPRPGKEGAAVVLDGRASFVELLSAELLPIPDEEGGDDASGGEEYYGVLKEADAEAEAASSKKNLRPLSQRGGHADDDRLGPP